MSAGLRFAFFGSSLVSSYWNGACTYYRGIIRSQGNNIGSDGSCGFTLSTDKQNTTPLLGPLQNNGGPTDTRAILAGSPAIDAGGASACLDLFPFGE